MNEEEKIKWGLEKWIGKWVIEDEWMNKCVIENNEKEEKINELKC